jgi:hypothetical protein
VLAWLGSWLIFLVTLIRETIVQYQTHEIVAFQDENKETAKKDAAVAEAHKREEACLADTPVDEVISNEFMRRNLLNGIDDKELLAECSKRDLL